MLIGAARRRAPQRGSGSIMYRVLPDIVELHSTDTKGLHHGTERQSGTRDRDIERHRRGNGEDAGMEVGKKHNIRMTCLQPGAVESELFEHVSDPGYRAQMEGLKEQMTFLKSDDIGDAVVYALQAPAHW
jgi:hypothetical protein